MGDAEDAGQPEERLDAIRVVLTICVVLVLFLAACVAVLTLALVMGWVATRFLPLALFQAALLSLGAIVIGGFVGVRVWRWFVPTPTDARLELSLNALDRIEDEVREPSFAARSRESRGRRK